MSPLGAVVFKLSEREKAMNLCIRLIVLKSLPIDCITDAEFRSALKYDNVFHPSSVKAMLKLSKL